MYASNKCLHREPSDMTPVAGPITQERGTPHTMSADSLLHDALVAWARLWSPQGFPGPRLRDIKLEPPPESSDKHLASRRLSESEAGIFVASSRTSSADVLPDLPKGKGTLYRCFSCGRRASTGRTGTSVKRECTTFQKTITTNKQKKKTNNK